MNKERLTTFIDAVLAIIMTILVLELNKPDPVTLAGFWALKENFFAYTLSFFWLGTMWINLHNEWYKIKRINGQTIWATMVMLFFSSLFPYATSLVSENFNNTAAQGFYGMIVLFITLANLLTYHTLSKANQEEKFVAELIKTRNHWLQIDVLIKIIGLILALTIFPPAMMYSVLLTLIVLVIPNQIKNLKQRHHLPPEQKDSFT
ncbi:TMEM175 family protein [Enterococcus timonensis]|uniref:TMEM175 family protein n=1 Tax=Enterococcus timonensis TaxID=1852364 RepID=UPI0008DAF1F1|nr:TMEM175 family protein [Enterococcus timonensis]